ncbi:Hypothetical predicted protein [Mytilus galloprovincialis]|uniref:Uncharacterized protein n=1 Tax=Mytilus galloprovincialis TaxID=29158 RepID=A0A8B6DV83_MYTGA|nr:Hypothetical predicted protein [Mytilus galloprovincialis]
MTQPVQNPNFTQQSPNSPAVGFYTSTPQNINSVMQPMVNPYSDTNCKLDDLTQKVNMIFDKMSTLDELSNKISTFDRAVQNLFKTVEKVSKRVDDVEQDSEILKKREFVRKAARELRDTHFGISEQFPKEVNDKRKELWPHFQEARRQRKKAFFKRDRLFIDGVEYCPSKKDEEKRDDDVPRRQYNKQGARPKKLNDPGRRQRRSSPH